LGAGPNAPDAAFKEYSQLRRLVAGLSEKQRENGGLA
jgi:hypothetical protein